MCLLLLSCEVSIDKQNNESDIETAKIASQNFYQLVKATKFKEAASYFGNTVGYEDGLHILENVNTHIGNLDTSIFLSGNSNVRITGTKKQAEFVLNFKAVYSKMEANEEIVIELINDSLKITGYHPRVKVPYEK